MSKELEDSILIAYILDSIDKIQEIATKTSDFKDKLFSDWIITWVIWTQKFSGM